MRPEKRSSTSAKSSEPVGIAAHPSAPLKAGSVKPPRMGHPVHASSDEMYWMCQPPRSVNLPGTRTTRAGIIFEVTKEPRSSSAFPIRRVIIGNARARGHEAEENVSRWPDDNSDMPTPHHQIARLWLRHSLKPFDSKIEVAGAGVGIAEAGFLVDGMNQVRTIARRMLAHFWVQRGGDHRQTIVLA